mmetsp:Transcript_61138/g.162429  ORF Transcript_61138/g.162429 Transcript_61138/m.162429 type:complete len:315 (-) Transcript_61138:456-1400(-)
MRDSRLSQLQMGLALCCFATCSVGMLVFNKVAIGVFPLECTLVAFQMAFTVIVMLVFFPTLHFGSLRDVLRWSMTAPFYTGMLMTSMLSLKHAPMSMLVVLRALSPLLCLVGESFFPQPLLVNKEMVLCICCMIGGTILYSTSLPHAALAGLPWIFLNMAIAVADRLLQRFLLAKDQCPVDISLTGVTLISNLWGVLLTSGFAYVQGEFSLIPSAIAALTSLDMVVITMTGVVGTGVCFCSVWTQRLISATSFLVFMNTNKCAVIFIEIAASFPNINPCQMIGAFAAILSGIGYSRARQACEASSAEKTPIMPK